MAQHISVRVPWKDNGYDGKVCEKPCNNNACLRLKNIAENRDDATEEILAGKPFLGNETKLPCLGEGATFMSSDTYIKYVNHPYKKNNGAAHRHFQDTKLTYYPYSLPGRPFRWTMLTREDHLGGLAGTIEELAEEFDIDYNGKSEPKLGFHTNWVQDEKNQRSIFDAFYREVIAKKSLVIPYVKQVPFIEDTKRVVIGIGFVEECVAPPAYETTDKNGLQSILWETMIKHSIRNDGANGFLFPYQEMMEYAKTNSNFDMRKVTVFAEDDYFDEFSYATEHLSHDAVISVILQSKTVLKNIENCLGRDYTKQIEWLDKRLEEVKKDRGLYVGAGNMLCAMGFSRGVLIADEIKSNIKDDENFVDKLQEAIREPQKYLSDKNAKCVMAKRTEQNAFLNLPEEKKSLFWLLSRFAFTQAQASALFHRQIIKKIKDSIKTKPIEFGCTSADIIANPYLIFEKTRNLDSDFQVPLKKIDTGLFLGIDESRDSVYNIDRNDERRIRALVIDLLEKQKEYGHSVYPQSRLIDLLNNLPLTMPVEVNSTILDSITDFIKGAVEVVDTKNDEAAYQLKSVMEFCDVIRKSVEKRVQKAPRHNITEDWSKIITNAFSSEKVEMTESEIAARKEKVAVLEEIANARLSVLLGGAGTGKTTVIAALCKSRQIQQGKILLLAPTGKARVRMMQAMERQGVTDFEAKTVAQFLVVNNGFDGHNMRYKLPDAPADGVPQTVIIDECSMLTEEMMGALFRALGGAGRIILVGDPNQLPPIGTGRPFVDLVNHLNIDIPVFPKVGKSYAELTVTRRQQEESGVSRLDMVLAEWFSNSGNELDDDVFQTLANNSNGHIEFQKWDAVDDLKDIIYKEIASVAGMQSVDDIDSFDISLGGVPNDKGWMNFGSKPSAIENWQILSAYKNDAAVGSATINRLITNKYRDDKGLKGKFKRRSTPNLLGVDGIVFGDKVINIRNQKKKGYRDGQTQDLYVANGEVGIVENLWIKGSYVNDRKVSDNTHQIRFSSQGDTNYNWYSTVKEEGSNDLELAYALTVHKAQGSEFDKVILILTKDGAMVTRELLYTAITRQKSKIIILYNDQADTLKKFSARQFSAIATRFTNLFELPDITQVENRFYENRLIHKTANGESVRSKSEVIIADALKANGVPYKYEQTLLLGSDGLKSPDFTIVDAEMGITVYWEHCGMMNDPSYKRRWERKKAIYTKHGITEENGNLIVTFDDEKGGIDSAAINDIIKKKF